MDVIDTVLFEVIHDIERHVVIQRPALARTKFADRNLPAGDGMAG